MKFHNSILVFCLVSAVRCAFQNVQSNQIDRSVHLGDFVNIGPGVIIEKGSSVGAFAGVEQRTKIGQNTNVGEYTQISSQCQIGDNVNIQTFVKLASGTVVGAGSSLKGYCTSGTNSQIGSEVTICGFAGIGNNAVVGDGSIVDEYATIGNGAKLQTGTYVGPYSAVGQSAIVDQSAVIYSFAAVSGGATIQPKELVIRTPSTFELLVMCEPNFSNTQSQSTTNSNAASSSTQFNTQMRQMITQQMNTLTTSCSHSSTPAQPALLPQIVQMYLVQYMGASQYQNCLQQVKQACNGGGGGSGGSYTHSSQSSVSIVNGQVFINGVRMNSSSSPAAALKSEFHFATGTTNKVLDAETQNELVQLLAMAQDINRVNRVKGDTSCNILRDVVNKHRNVITTSPSSTNHSC